MRRGAIGATPSCTAGMTPVTRVVVVDDQSLVREGITALLSRSGDIEVVGEAADGEAGAASGDHGSRSPTSS